MIIGYTTGVFDLFHVGHVRMLRNSKAMCDRLMVGVSTDDLVAYKNKQAIIPFEERIEVVRSCKYVDVAVPQVNMNKMDAWERYKFNIMFVGDDWYKTAKWQELEEAFSARNVRIIYYPYTQGTSSTMINETLNKLRKS